MRGRAGYVLALCLGSFVVGARAQSVRLDERDAVVWSHEQVVEGRAEGTGTAGVLYVNDAPIAFTADGDFAVPVQLGEGETTIVACADAAGTPVCSDTLRWTLGYRLRPELYVYATVEGRAVTLHGRLLANPDDAALTYAWVIDSGNPQSVSFSTTSDTVATVVLPEDAAYGEYYFDWNATADDGDVGRARTFVTVDSTGVRAFDLTQDYAAWIDATTIYEVTPRIFAWSGKLNDVTARIPDLADLGVGAIWLQPIYETVEPEQGYHVVDYFSIRSSFGTEDDLRRLVATAHAHGLRVLLDFVPGHTSIQHPYAQDAVRNGAASHYHDFYQHTRSGSRFAGVENIRREGLTNFVHYFDWNGLVNLNHDNPEVRRWMEEAGRYWIEQFDIDGYRIDAIWGVDARTPASMQAWRFALKRLKPEVLLLGESYATRPESFENRYDVAYDWLDTFAQDQWVSHWSWQTTFSSNQNRTIFNASERQRSLLLRAALTNRGPGFPPRAKVLRFMENNDVWRFIGTHDLPRTKLAAALLFSLPGVPLLYNGQEIGFGEGAQPDHPYDPPSFIFNRQSIRSQDRLGLFPFYERLLDVRRAYPALYGEQYEEVDVLPDAVDDYVFAFHRWEGDEHLFTVLNLSGEAAEAQLALPVDRLGLDAGTTYYLTDLVTGEYVAADRDELAALTLSLPGYAARLYVLGDEVVDVPTAAEPTAEIPATVVLAQNYPNPFNPVTVIPFALPSAGPVRLTVYDVLGREVALLVDDVLPAGRHEAVFDGHDLASGTYFYRVAFDGRSYSRPMLLVK